MVYYQIIAKCAIPSFSYFLASTILKSSLHLCLEFHQNNFLHHCHITSATRGQNQEKLSTKKVTKQAWAYMFTQPTQLPPTGQTRHLALELDLFLCPPAIPIDHEFNVQSKFSSMLQHPHVAQCIFFFFSFTFFQSLRLCYFFSPFLSCRCYFFLFSLSLFFPKVPPTLHVPFHLFATLVKFFH